MNWAAQGSGKAPDPELGLDDLRRLLQVRLQLVAVRVREHLQLKRHLRHLVHLILLEPLLVALQEAAGVEPVPRGLERTRRLWR